MIRQIHSVERPNTLHPRSCPELVIVRVIFDVFVIFLTNITQDRTIDWWTLGVLLYEMLSGLPPFYDEVTDKMYEKILKNPLVFGDDIGEHARSILSGLLTRDPTQRLGVSGADAIKRHPFFAEIDWALLLAKKVQPPFKPSVLSPVDVSNFDTVFTAEAPLDSVVEGSQLSKTVQDQFSGFSWNGSSFPVSLK
jgi:serum/glucocorticoid-regulated kinase 2